MARGSSGSADIVTCQWAHDKFNGAVGGAPDSFLLHNDLAFLPAEHNREPGFTLAVLHHFGLEAYRLAVFETSHLVNQAPRSGLGVLGCLSPKPYGGQIGRMGAKARKDGLMVEAAKIFLGGSMGAEPKLAELHEKAFPLGDLADVLELLLLEQFGARRRELAGS